jgi:hypothetical protein
MIDKAGLSAKLVGIAPVTCLTEHPSGRLIRRLKRRPHRPEGRALIRKTLGCIEEGRLAAAIG